MKHSFPKGPRTMDKASFPTFSVVTPSFNQDAYLEETIKSVLSQKGDFFIDHIIIDGGSTDASVSIIEKYEELLERKQWPVDCRGIRYRWVSEKDEGQTDAIEKGFRMATGDIGVWLNSDDLFYDQNALETVARYFEENDIDLLVGNGINIDSEGKLIGYYQTKRIDMKELIFLDYHILQPAAFLKIRYYLDFPMDRSLNFTFDVDFFIRLLRSGIRFLKVPELLACNRLHFECKTVSGKGRLVKEFMKIQKKHANPFPYHHISWFYKYLAVLAQYRYRDSKVFWQIYLFLRKCCYYAILGTWGRK